MLHCGLALDGHGPEERMVSFHSDKAGPIVGVGSTDQGSKAEHIICCGEKGNRLVKRNFSQCIPSLSKARITQLITFFDRS